MNKSTAMETARVQFGLGRTSKGFEIDPSKLVGKGNVGHKCQDSRNEFSYNRTLNEVKLGDYFLAEGKKVSAEELKYATQHIIDAGKTATDELSV